MNKYFLTVEIESDLEQEELIQTIFWNKDLSKAQAIGLTIITEYQDNKMRKKMFRNRNNSLDKHIKDIKAYGPIE